MNWLDSLISTAVVQWIRWSPPPPTVRARVLRRAAAIRRERWKQASLPAHLEPWNLPKRNAGGAGLWNLQSVALAVSFPSGGVKLML